MQDKLKEVLAQRSISIYKLSKDLGVNYGTFHTAINGRTPMYPKYKKLISEYLGIAENELFKEEK